MTGTLTAEQIAELERLAAAHSHYGTVWGAFPSDQILTLIAMAKLVLGADQKIDEWTCACADQQTRAEIAASDLADMAKHAMTLEEILAVHENYQAWLLDTTALAKQRNEANYRADKAEAEAARYRKMAVRMAELTKATVNLTCSCGSCARDREKYAVWRHDNPDIAALLSEPKP